VEADDVYVTAGHKGYLEVVAQLGRKSRRRKSRGKSGRGKDSYIKLVYLRSRYYSSDTGRFNSKDTWQGDYTSPMSYNAWLYGYANPVLNTDPSGLDVGCPGKNGGDCKDYRDLTDWLYREMVANAHGPDVQRWREWNTIAAILAGSGGLACLSSIIVGPGVIVAGGVVMAGGAVFEATALYEYGESVKDGAIWDFKDQIGIQLGSGITLCTQNGCANNIEYSVPGNIHFAYIGAAAGFLGPGIKAGAGYAEITDPAHNPKSPQYTGPYIGPEGLSGIFGPTWWDPDTWDLGDEPTDNQAVTFGIELWKKYQGNLTKEQFQSELASYIGKLSHHEPSSAPIKDDVKNAFPYPVGYFNNRGASYRP
jgi:RHS repeat-associated protein